MMQTNIKHPTKWLVANSKQRVEALIGSIFIGIALSFFFVKTSHSVFAWILQLLASQIDLKASSHPLWPPLVFALLALLFHLSIRKRSFDRGRKISKTSLWQMSILPIAIAFIFGQATRETSFFKEDLNITKALIWWNVLCVPVGEEALFRGWFFTLVSRFYPNTFFSATNPLPVAIWTSSIAFSFWHIQNLGLEPLMPVLFQMSYTFILGIWFGFLRWKTNTILYCILAHAALNFASLI